VSAMMDYADVHFAPTWKDGGYYYPLTPNYQSHFNRDENGYIANISPVTGNVLVGFARVNPKDGIWALYNRPWDESHFAQPFISDVDYLEANVNQAVFDAANDALLVGLVPGPIKSDAVTFRVHQLDAAKSYSVFKDGQLLGEVQRGRADVDAAKWQPDGTLKITTDLREPHSFAIVAAGAVVAARP